MTKGEYFVNGKRLTAFSHEEEIYAHTAPYVPFNLQAKLISEGAVYSKTNTPFAEHVVVDGRLGTGENPNSGVVLGEAIVTMYQQK